MILRQRYKPHPSKSKRAHYYGLGFHCGFARAKEKNLGFVPSQVCQATLEHVSEREKTGEERLTATRDGDKRAETKKRRAGQSKEERLERRRREQQKKK